jgi:hypothetical protein
MSGPNWCEPCKDYRPRDHECARQQPKAAPPAIVIDTASIDVPEDVQVAEASDPRAVSWWRRGYAACLQDQAERRATR